MPTDNEGPVCPSCGSDNLRVVYRSDVVQPVMEWEPTDTPGVWAVKEYDSADVDFEGEIEDQHVECGSCAATAMRVGPDAETFEIIEPGEADEAEAPAAPDRAMTVIGEYDDGGIYVEHVEADDVPGAIRAALAIDPARWQTEIVMVARGHILDADPKFTELGSPFDMPAVWTCTVHASLSCDQPDGPTFDGKSTVPRIECAACAAFLSQ